MSPPPLGVVVIGRNEGERLRACLEGLAGAEHRLVYVDSGSSDGSVALARERGGTVVELDPALPFTAARARNAGLEVLTREAEARFVQFVDGDCELAPGWLDRARRELEARAGLAVVCGRRRERRPEASVYNALCDVEWDTPVGDAEACGGDFMARREALEQVGGFDAGLIAGEEPELCIRLRAAGWKIARVDAEMTRHDADIHRFGQWWRRALRAGHCYAELSWLHGAAAGRIGPRSLASVLAYAVALPAVALGAAPVSGGASLALLGAYPLLAWRVARGARARGRGAAESRAYGGFLVLGKFAEAAGVLRFALSLLRGRRTRLIEYKGAPATGTD